MKMNGTVKMNGYTRSYNNTLARSGKTPFILVLFARFVLWLTKEENVRSIKCGAALMCVLFIAFIAGAIGVGAVPLFLGAIAAFAFGSLGLLLTFDLN